MQVLLRAVTGHCLGRQFSKADRDRACQLIKQLAREAGELMMKGHEQKPEFKMKAHQRDLVTQTDKAVERLLVDGIRKQFPDHEIIAEEGTEGTAKSWVLSDAPTWIIDPVDGTMNFVHGFPHFCTSIALYVERRAVLGWIDNPMLRHTYVAQQGSGFYFNEQPMRVSGQRDLKQSLVCLDWTVALGEDGKDSASPNIFKLLPMVHGVRALGSTALNLAQVAIGACDAYLQFGSHVWDWAAGVLMVEEAGGVVIDPCGGPFDIYSRRLLATATPELAEQMVPQVQQLFPQPRDDEPTNPGKQAMP